MLDENMNLKIEMDSLQNLYKINNAKIMNIDKSINTDDIQNEIKNIIIYSKNEKKSLNDICSSSNDKIIKLNKNIMYDNTISSNLDIK